MRKAITILGMLLFLLAPAPVRAQEPSPFAGVEVNLWPEFDKPAMLVMVEIRLDEDLALPQDVTLHIPSSASVHQVLLGSSRDTLTIRDAAYEIRAAGDWQVLTIAAVQQPFLRIEYYDPLTFDGLNRHYTWQWREPFPTDGIDVIFQVPVDASDVHLEPQANGQMTDVNGLVYYRIRFDAPAENGVTAVAVDYYKITARVSVTIPRVEPVAPISSAEGRVSISNYAPWLIGAAGVVLILLGLGVGMVYWRGTGRNFLPRGRHPATQAEKREPLPALNCPECGHRLQPGDQFCRVCGTRLKNED